MFDFHNFCINKRRIKCYFNILSEVKHFGKTQVKHKLEFSLLEAQYTMQVLYCYRQAYQILKLVNVY